MKKVYKYGLPPVKGKKETVTLHDIPTGTYAVVIFQDLNGNRKFDSSFLGVPKEPFGLFIQKIRLFSSRMLLN